MLWRGAEAGTDDASRTQLHGIWFPSNPGNIKVYWRRRRQSLRSLQHVRKASTIGHGNVPSSLFRDPITQEATTKNTQLWLLIQKSIFSSSSSCICCSIGDHPWTQSSKQPPGGHPHWAREPPSLLSQAWWTETSPFRLRCLPFIPSSLADYH